MGRGYVKHRPDRPPDQATEAQVQAMNAKLAARVACSSMVEPRAVNSGVAGSSPATPANSQPLQAAQSPKEKSLAGPIYWVKGPDNWSIESRCGRFKIRREVEHPATKHLDATFRYRAYRMTSSWDFELGVRTDPNEARNLCVQSLQERN